MMRDMERRGFDLAILEASHMGHSVYEKLGFKGETEVTLMWKYFVEGLAPAK